MSDTPLASGADAAALPTRHVVESDEPLLFAVAGTHHGRTREANQDTFLCEAAGEFGLYAAIDGVGGYAGGHVAATIARDRIRSHVGRLSSAPAELLREAVLNANNAIVERSEADPALSQMACVLTVAMVDPQQQRVTAAHVGDTRLYHRQGDAIAKLTPDHSFVGLREDAGQISEAEAMAHPRRNEILRDVGSERRTADDPDFVFTTEAAFREGDALMLCSDGLTDLVPHAELTRVLVEHRGDPRRIVNELVHAALEAGGTDNVTVVVVEYSGAARTTAATPRTRTTDTREFPPDAFTASGAAASGAALASPAAPDVASGARGLPAAPPEPVAAAPASRVPGWAKAGIGLLALLLVAGASYIGYQRFVAPPDAESTPALDSPTTDEPPLPAPDEVDAPEANDLAFRIASSPDGRVNLGAAETFVTSTLPIPTDLVLDGAGSTLRIEPETVHVFEVASGVRSVVIRNLTLDLQDPLKVVALVDLPSPDVEVTFENVSVVGENESAVPAVVVGREAGDTRPLNFTLSPEAAPALPPGALDDGAEPLGGAAPGGPTSAPGASGATAPAPRGLGREP